MSTAPGPADEATTARPTTAHDAEEHTESSESPEPAGVRGGRGWRGQVAAVAAVFLAALAISVLIGVPSIHHAHNVGNTDETSYFDYLYKVGHGHYVIGRGETIAPAVAREVGCRGIGTTTTVVIKPNAPTCRGTSNAFAKVRDSASIDPPTYYVMTSIGARTLLHLGVTHDLLDAGRLVGLFWAALTATVFYFFALRFGASRLASAIGVLFIFADPALRAQWTHITPHALDLLVGIGVLWIGLEWARSGRRWWLLLLAGFVPPMCKATDVSAPVVLGLALVIGAFWPGTALHRQWRRVLAGVGCLAAGLLAGTLITVAVRNHYALVSGNEFPQFDVTRFHSTYLTSQVGVFLQSHIPGPSAFIGLTAMFLIVGCLVGFVLYPRPESDPELGPFAVALLAVMIFGAWLFVASNYVLLKQYVLIPLRYGLGIWPGVLLFLVLALRTKAVQAVYAAVGVCLLLASLPEVAY